MLDDSYQIRKHCGKAGCPWHEVWYRGIHVETFRTADEAVAYIKRNPRRPKQ